MIPVLTTLLVRTRALATIAGLAVLLAAGACSREGGEAEGGSGEAAGARAGAAANARSDEAAEEGFTVDTQKVEKSDEPVARPEERDETDTPGGGVGPPGYR